MYTVLKSKDGHKKEKKMDMCIYTPVCQDMCTELDNMSLVNFFVCCQDTCDAQITFVTKVHHISHGLEFAPDEVKHDRETLHEARWCATVW